MNDDPLTPQPPQPDDGHPSGEAAEPIGDETTVSRRLSVWRPTDEYWGGAPEDSAPILSAPARIDLTGDSRDDDRSAHDERDADYRPAAVAAPEAVSGAALHYGDSVDTAFAGAPLGSSGFEPDGLGAKDKELDLFEHLIELRQRLLKSFAAVGLAMIGTWVFREPILNWFAAPISREMVAHHAQLTTVNPTEGFSIYLQTSFAAAVLIAIPIVLYQLWSFIEPALTRHERRYGIILVPFSITLFFAGALFGFVLTPLFFRFFLQYTPPHTTVLWTFASSASFMAKTLLGFGICFQVPVIVVFLNKIGIVSRAWLIKYWRHVIVVIYVVVGLVTPTWDPVTLVVAGIPPCLLYAFSIWLVKWL